VSRAWRWTIFRQALLVLVGGLVLAHAILTATILLLPPPRPPGITFRELVAGLQQRDPAPTEADQRWVASVESAAPTPPADWVVARHAVEALARVLELPAADVRMWVPQDSDWTSSRRSGSRGLHGAWSHRGSEQLLAAARVDGTWRVVRVEAQRGPAEWQLRAMMVFGLSLLALLPLAWWFARRLSRPIQAFAEAADRVGHDATAPKVEVEGPDEVRTAAHAVNAMQERIAAQLRERQAMMVAIAHDLRTPLSRIAFRIEEAEPALREPVQRDIAQLTSMIGQAMDFMRGRHEPPRREPVDIAALLDELVELEAGLGHVVSISRSADGDPRVAGDPVSLRRLFQNLVDNAQRHAGGAELAWSLADGRLEVVVADRGPGLSPEQLARVFEPFERGEAARTRGTPGMGLGLTIARAIAQDHGGTLELRARAGGGLEAVLRLPAAGADRA
jgi:signal transduction histidine kinase